MKKLFSLLTIIITSFLLIGIGTQSILATQTEDNSEKSGDVSKYLPLALDSSQKSIPEWIKNTAGWWAEGKIIDASFIAGIQWLIANGVITVSSTEQEAKSGYEIPKWIKNNAGWWAEGKIPDSAFLSGLEWLIEHGIIILNLPKDIDPYDVTFSPLLPDIKQKNLQYITTTFFHIFGDLDSIQVIDGIEYWGTVYLGIDNEQMDDYNNVSIWNNQQQAIVVYPFFTNTAYNEPGFYTYYRGECDTCTTIPFADSRLMFASSGNAFQALSLMGYKLTNDITIDKNPDILKKYDKVIMLHNEYVTQAMFDAITNHPNVIYLYPNALYAEIEVDYENNLITLIRGHDYPPEDPVSNGFDWEFDNTHPYEYDTECSNMEFYNIDNGWMTNCYPEQVFVNSKDGTYNILEIIKAL